MRTSKIFDLTPAQEKAFKELEKAYKKCIKSGIYFYNCYGALSAVDKSKISKYINEPEGSCLSNQELMDGAKFINIPNEWADDQHYWILTDKGKKILDDEQF
jgi:hypothetical protein